MSLNLMSSFNFKITSIKCFSANKPMLISDSEDDEDAADTDAATRSTTSEVSEAIDLTNIPSDLPRRNLLPNMDSIISIVKFNRSIIFYNFQLYLFKIFISRIAPLVMKKILS